MKTVKKKRIVPINRLRKLPLRELLIVILLIIATIAGVWQLPVTQQFISRASGTPAAFVISTTTQLGPLPRPWRNLAQGGEDHAWRIAPIAQSVRELQPEYIRIDHIYDFFDIVGGTSGQLTFDFSKLDLLLDDIELVGAKPYIALSYMPPAISSGDIISAPRSYADWQIVVQRTIEHISGTRGTADVYYEVWNEPDLFGSWSYYGNKNYLDLYSASARGASAARTTTPFKIGGPATTALYKNWFHALAKHVTENDLRFDFFSWHRYDHNVDSFDADLKNVQSWVAEYPQLDGQIEFHISEWGHESDMHPGYDTAAGAAHTVAGSIALINPQVKSFVFEIQDGKDPNGSASWGRWGLLQHQSFGSKPKPRYWGLRMLDSLPSNRLQIRGQGTWVRGVAAATNDGSVHLVLANYDEGKRNSESVPVTFLDISAGSYELSLEYLNGNKTSLFSSTETSSVSFIVPMPPHSVVYSKLIRQEE